MKIPTFPFHVAGIGFCILGSGVALLLDVALGLGITCYGMINLLFWQNLKHLKRIQRLEAHIIPPVRLPVEEEQKEGKAE